MRASGLNGNGAPSWLGVRMGAAARSLLLLQHRPRHHAMGAPEHCYREKAASSLVSSD